MGNRDLELLLAVKSGDSAKYQQNWEKLTQYAESIAMSFFPSPVLRGDAVQQAMDEVGDWLKSDYCLQVEYPWTYTKRIIFNSLSRSSKNRQLKELEFTSVRDTTVKNTLSLISDNIRQEFTKAADDREKDEQGTGFRFYQSTGVGKSRKKDDGYYRPHKFHEWVKALNELFVCDWRWNGRDWKRKSIYPQYEEMDLGLFTPSAEAYAPWLWSRYHVVTGLIQDIRNPSEKRIMKALLSGLKQTEIARKFNVTKQRISKVKVDCLKEWEWADPDVDEAQIILWTHCLAAFLQDFINNLAESDNPYREKPPSIKLFNTSETGRYEYMVTTSYNKYGEEEKEGYWIQPYLKEQFYNRVIRSGETQAYFGDLEKTEENIRELILLSQECYYRWYPKRTAIKYQLQGWKEAQRFCWIF